jgi:two-component system, OmpR family, KDP operon response regulator KdpE
LDNITHHICKRHQEARISHFMVDTRSTPTVLNHNNHMDIQPLTSTRVLIVDDDSDTTDLLKIILEPNGFKVIVANTGKHGVELARNMGVDMMVVDLLMPDMDGLQVCREVRKFSSMPILILSAVSRPNVAEEVLDSGADDFLVKPMSSGVLIASMNRLARRARAEHQSQTSNGNYLNP